MDIHRDPLGRGYVLRIPTPRGQLEITTDTEERARDEYTDWLILAGGFR